jgi:hypothetical protein
MAISLDALLSEALCASSGYDRLIQENPTPLTQADVDKAMNVLDEIPKLCDELVADGPDKNVEIPAWGDYKAEAARLNATQRFDGGEDEVAVPTERRLALVGDLAPAVGLAYLNHSQKVIAFLRKSLPRATEQTLTGPKQLEPSRFDLAAYWRKRDLAQDPLLAVRYARDSLLIHDEVATLALMYPELYGAIVRATIGALATQAAKHGPDWLPRRRRSIEILMQVSPISPEFARQLQEAARMAEAANAGGAEDALGMSGMQVDVDTNRIATPTQRIADR